MILASNMARRFQQILGVVLCLGISHAAGNSADIVEDPIAPEHRAHWAFRPLREASPPATSAGDGARNPVDAFIHQRLVTSGLRPTPEADRRTLIRRLVFDLTGLPPTPAELREFLDDPAPDAYERLVDRLLASPRHGERMAQHWLDLARFAETDGFEHDLVRPNAWRYRDWVIAAIDADLPYDRFVALQLAGDELAANDAAAKAATGFCLAGPDMPDINSQDERRHFVLNDVTATVGSVFLGLQLGCAQCHDHKYDPLSQGDFYRLRAFFESAVSFEKNKLNATLGERPRQPWATHIMLRGDFRRPGPVVQPAFPRIADPWDSAPPSGSIPPRVALASWLTRPDHPLTTRVIANRLWQQHFGEGLSRSPSDFGVTGEEPSHPELLDFLARELPRRQWSIKSLRRTLVTTTTYRQGSRTTTPGWDESTRRQVAATWTKAKLADPDNRLWWRFPRRRLDGESLRDAMLSAADALNMRRGGPGVMAPLPSEVAQTLLANQWKVVTDPAEHDRRSLYLFARRNLRYPVLEAFDRPDAQLSCARRNRSTTAPQALLMLNSDFSRNMAERLARVAVQESPLNEVMQVQAAYRRALGREPHADEVAQAIEFLQRQRKSTSSPGGSVSDKSARHAALADFCLALFNSSEFAYVD